MGVNFLPVPLTFSSKWNCIGFFVSFFQSGYNIDCLHFCIDSHDVFSILLNKEQMSKCVVKPFPSTHILKVHNYVDIERLAKPIIKASIQTLIVANSKFDLFDTF